MLKVCKRVRRLRKKRVFPIDYRLWSFSERSNFRACHCISRPRAAAPATSRGGKGWEK